MKHLWAAVHFRRFYWSLNLLQPVTCSCKLRYRTYRPVCGSVGLYKDHALYIYTSILWVGN